MTPNSDGDTITLTETDEVNQPTATYVYSESLVKLSPKNKEVKGRVDVIHPQASPSSWSSTALLNSLADVFLPAGYPHSVTSDYLPYQIFDSLQAFSSSIAGLLSSRAVLQGVGVGNANASPTSALLLNIFQDTSGRIATILFAHRVGTALEPECKMYRFAADIFNDLAMVLDCLSPLIPAGIGRVTVLSAGGVLRALCGVAGGSSKASLKRLIPRNHHLPNWDTNSPSKVGSFIVSHITASTATWITLLALLALHLTLNYAAVRSVQMTSLNRQRANIVFSALLESDPDLVHEAAEKEKSSHQQLYPATKEFSSQAVSYDGIPLRNLDPARIGVPLHQFLSPSSSSDTTVPFPALITLFANESYILSLSPTSSGPKAWQAAIILKTNCTPQSQLKGWVHALLATRILSIKETGSDSEIELIMDVLSRTLEFLNQDSRFDGYMLALEGVGWNLGIAALETKSGRRVCDIQSTNVNID
ncbi:hypothetical protein ASPWEDRAFT_26181 [Aspergillus wentii DTO 134E9]|uniref:Protein root UVB sensitive/RUS domain-containing protein n=1 Tax=Aspergillus wentii DTO 134E9 TaxID=1073089 RepID=A0A1L9RP61_ASPWE|nr:uncharacterized protein ASPWEDRAFT_26181 [Aspergillus wentii DTO 134E9]OJJ36726.1 hypothetical protein ASPWEDRAFT_26181 [Aspergillus wentii DTO 134E9]